MGRIDTKAEELLTKARAFAARALSMVEDIDRRRDNFDLPAPPLGARRALLAMRSNLEAARRSATKALDAWTHDTED